MSATLTDQARGTMRNEAREDATARRCVLDGHLDDVANACVAALGATQHLDAQHFARTSVIGHFEPAFCLNHGVCLPNLIRQVR